MKKVRIGLPDGNGCFGTLEFWKQYFSDIGVEYVGVDDEEYKLEQYVRESNSIFPSSICVNSKYRLGRAIELADKVDYFLFFYVKMKFLIVWQAYIELNGLNIILKM